MDPSDLRSIRALPGNNRCFDCGVTDTQWASLSFGVLFCIDCSGKHRGLGVHIDFVRSLLLDSWTPEQVAIMKAGGNQQCATAFRRAKIPMAVTDFGTRNSLENNHQDFRNRYTHPAAKAYKQQLLERANGTTSGSGGRSSGNTDTATVSNGTDEKSNTNTTKPSQNGSNTRSQSSTLSQADKDRIYELARLDPELPWHAPIPSVIAKVAMLAARVGLGFPGMPLLVSFGMARYYLYPDSALLQGLGYLLAGIPLVGSILFGRKLCLDFTRGRIPPFKSAQNILAQRMETGRAIRTPGYDVFLPLKNPKVKNYPGLVLYPGWLINHTSYSPIAAALSDCGIVVVVLSMEPFRASMHSSQVEAARYMRVLYELLAEVAPDHPVENWAVGGHSVGAHLAMKIARATSPGTNKLVLWGCGSRPIDHRTAHLADKSSLDVLVLNGSEDRTILQLTYKSRVDFRALLPPKTVYKTIPGGNHNGFAHYEKYKNKKRDGVRTITLEKQQEIVVEETVNFLKGTLFSSEHTSKTQTTPEATPSPTFNPNAKPLVATPRAIPIKDLSSKKKD